MEKRESLLLRFISLMLTFLISISLTGTSFADQIEKNLNLDQVVEADMVIEEEEINEIEEELSKEENQEDTEENIEEIDLESENEEELIEEDEIKEELESYRLELEAEKKGTKSSVLENGENIG